MAMCVSDSAARIAASAGSAMTASPSQFGARISRRSRFFTVLARFGWVLPRFSMFYEVLQVLQVLQVLPFGRSASVGVQSTFVNLENPGEPVDPRRTCR